MAADWVETKQFAAAYDTNLALLTETRDYLQRNLARGQPATDDPIAKLTANPRGFAPHRAARRDDVLAAAQQGV